jgi:nickel-dependent lactate racemase
MPEYALKYGHRTLTVNVPFGRLLGVLEPRAMEPLKDPAAAVAEALDNPIDSPPFNDIVRAADRVLVIVPDITRPAGASIYMPVLLERLNRLGVRDAQVSVLFALGHHRKQTRAEQVGILGEEVAARVEFFDHDAYDKSSLVFLGTTRHGTPVWVNRRVLEADKVIVTGSISLHYFAGFGGGRKCIIPGVAALETCQATHLHVFTKEGTGKHPLARTGILEGNPVHEDILEGVEMVRPHFLLNTVVDAQQRLLRVVAGDYIKSHREGCRQVMQLSSVPIAQRADLVLTSCGGFPKDINFIQSHKTLDYTINAVREGGVLILLAECQDGFGHETFHHWFRYQDLQTFEQALRANYEIYGQTAFSTLEKAKRVRVLLISSLPDADVRAMAIEPAHSPEEALLKAQQLVGPEATYYVIPSGSTLFPVAQT